MTQEKSNFVLNADNEYNHRPWWKVLINTPLRWLQRGHPYNLLICSNCTLDSPPKLIGYEIKWIKMKNHTVGKTADTS